MAHYITATHLSLVINDTLTRIKVSKNDAEMTLLPTGLSRKFDRVNSRCMLQKKTLLEYIHCDNCHVNNQ